MAKQKKNASVFGSIEGLEPLLVKMRELPAATEKAVIRPALRVGAKVSMEEIRSRAPREGGDLYKSFKVRAIARTRTKIGSRVIVDRKTLKTDGREGFYAAMQELGWRPGKRGSNAGNKPVQGRRFIREGLYQSEGPIRVAVIREANKQFPKAIAKLSRKIDMKAAKARQNA